jgi:hypothetical protein
MQPLPHRVYIHASQYKEHWTVQYLEQDLKTPVGRMYNYSRIDQVREILKRADCSPEQWAELEHGIRCWGIGACFLNLAGEQYAKLKTQRGVPRPANNQTGYPMRHGSHPNQ